MGHVEKDIAKGIRPPLTVRVSGDTFHTIDRLCAILGLSRGRLIDRLVSEAKGGITA